MKRLILYIFNLTVGFLMSCNSGTMTVDPLSEKAMAELKQVLHEQSLFIKVHAAEYLVWLGYPEEVKKVYLQEDSLHGTETPYRIGIWRVLAQAEEKAADSLRWTEKIMAVYADSLAPDRLHATETLAKLRQSPLRRFPAITQATLHSENPNLNTYALWAVSYDSENAMEKNRGEFLHMALADSNQIIRRISAYILRRTGGLSQSEWSELVERSFAEPDTSGMKRSLLNTAFVTAPHEADTMQRARIHEDMLRNNHLFSIGERIELALTLADGGTPGDLPVLEAMLDNKNATGIYDTGSKEAADIRATAAYAILKIKTRQTGTEQQQ